MSAASTVSGTGLPDLLDPAVIQDPTELYRRLLTEAPVWQVPGTSMYVIASWDLVVEAVGRTEELSSNLEQLLYTGADGRPALYDMAPLGANIQTLATADPPQHTIHRKVVFPALVERRMTGLEPTTRDLGTEMLDDALEVDDGRSIEWVGSVASRLPLAVLAQLMGFAGPDLDSLVAWSLDGAAILAGTCTADDMVVLTERSATAGMYLAEELMAAPPDPEAGIIGGVRRGLDDGVLTFEEAVSTLLILLAAGGESTGALIGNAVRLLAEHPDVQSRLRAESSLVPTFVEEALRLDSPFRGHYRIARRPTEIGGVTIPAGSPVLLLWAAANRDPTQFDDPEELRLDREHPRGHVGFGRGLHFCIGAPLARMEARVVLELLLSRTRAFTLDPATPPAYVNSMFVRRHEHLDLLVEPSNHGRASLTPL